MIEMEKTWVNISDVLFFQEGPGVRNTQYTTEGVKLLNVANLVDGKVDLSTSDRYISEDEAYGKYSHFLCDVGDFVVASSGIKVEYIDKKMGFIEETMLPLCMNTSTIRFKVLDEKQLRIRYFMYYLKSQHFKGQLAREITGSAQLNYGPSHLKKMVMPLVAISTQDEIVQKMDKVQKIIDMRQMELSALDNLIKARFVEMFGDPIINPNAYKRITLNDACTKVTDGTHDTPERYEEGVLLLTGKNIRATGIAFDDVEYVSEEDHRIIYDRCNPEYGDVLYTNIGVNYGTACFNNLDYEFSMKNVALLKPKRELLDGHYLWICLNYMREYILSQNQVGGAQTFMGLATIKKISIPVPSINLQKRFAEFLVQVDKSKVVA